MNTRQENENRLTLREVAEAVASNNGISQRKLTGKLAVALGLTNFYLKRCVKKALVKVKQAPPNEETRGLS